MIQKYKNVSIIYGGSGKQYASKLNEKIVALARQKRYPINSRIIMESVLTRELLFDVMELFRSSDVCVAFLTAEDTFNDHNCSKRRLRQNVVFELGMALIELGRENCILLSDFDTKATDFELPSDMNSLEIRYFDSNEFDALSSDIIEKILQLSGDKSEVDNNDHKLQQYDNLFTRKIYYMDFDDVFETKHSVESGPQRTSVNEILDTWLSECKGLPYYDEKAIYMFERIVFLPIFGSTDVSRQWLLKMYSLLDSYSEEDVRYYGGTKLLDFVKNLAECIINYTQIKFATDASDYDRYRALAEDFQYEDFPGEDQLNPLLSLVYYDYLGLTFLRMYRLAGKVSDVEAACKYTEKALKLSERVDMSHKLWQGFLEYNLARTISFCGQTDEALFHYKKAIKIRDSWIKRSKYSTTVRNALSSEYFIAYLDYLDFCKRKGLKSKAEIQKDYDILEIKLDEYCNHDERLEKLSYVRVQLNKKRSEW